MKNILVVVTILFVFLLVSCSNKSYNHKYHHAYRTSAPSAYPISRKSTPVAKKYIVPNKKKAILGQSGTFLK